MYYRKTIFDTVKLWVGSIFPKEDPDHNIKTKVNIKEHVSLVEDLIVDLTEAAETDIKSDENAEYTKQYAKQALIDLKTIIDDALEK